MSNLLVAIFGPMIVLLLGYSLYTSNDRFGEMNDRFIALEATIDRRFAAFEDRIDRRLTALEDSIDRRFTAFEDRIDRRFTAFEASMDARFAAQDTKIDTRFAQIDARFAAQDAKIDEVNLRLTALTAVLGKTEEVEAALDVRLASNVVGVAPHNDADWISPVTTR